MIGQPLDEEAIFNVATCIGSEDARRDYLAQVCGGDAELYQRVMTLLNAHDDNPSFMEPPVSGVSATADFPAITERPGTQIGPYKLIEEIGSGGMGVVYMALQREPVRRKVALKIIKPGMDTREVIGRFKAEEQALAMMDHPNIAKVHEAGTTDSHRPYFVMELVNGVPVTEYCDDNKLSTRQRLELFTAVCNAVQHAHQKGVIHRDIKPSNILVTLHDGVPVPKIIDFGIAKAINQELAASTVVTRFGQMVGTPMYMSPEQAERSGLDVDTRSDIYSLGVLLYELLTGTTPFTKEQLQEAGLDEIRRLIREQDPERPSTRISTLGKAATTMSEQRNTSPTELSNALRQELDWIVMKALDKDRTRRYETASDFARDIQRYLGDEPVAACPPSRIYRLRKVARRNRVAVLTTSAVALALIFGAAVAGGQAYRATQAERLANKQLKIANEQKRLAKEQEQLAKKQQRLAEEAAERERDLRTEAESARKQAEQVTEFLVEIFRSPDPQLDGRTITVAEMLDQAKTRVETEFEDDPVLQGKLLGAIGETYIGLGLLNEALHLHTALVRLTRDFLGGDHPETLAAMNKLACCYRAVGNYDESISLHKKTLALQRKLLGSDDERTLASVSNLSLAYIRNRRFADAISLLEKSFHLQKQTLREEHPVRLKAMGHLAWAYKENGRLDDALPLFEENLRINEAIYGREHPATIIAMNNLALGYGALQQWDKELPLQEEVLRLMRRVMGSDHPNTLTSMSNLATVYLATERVDDALALLQEAHGLQRDKLGADHPDTLRSMDNLAQANLDSGQADEAISLLQDKLQLETYRFGRESPHTLFTLNRLGVTYCQTGQFDLAIPLYEEALRLRKEVNGKQHKDTLQVMGNLAASYQEAKRPQDAIPLYEELLSIRARGLGPEHVDTLWAKVCLARSLHSGGRRDQAQEHFENALTQMEATLGSEHWKTVSCIFHLARLHADQGEFDEAERLLLKAQQAKSQKPAADVTPRDKQQMEMILTKLIEICETTDQPDKAAEGRTKLEELRQAGEQEDAAED